MEHFVDDGLGQDLEGVDLLWWKRIQLTQGPADLCPADLLSLATKRDYGWNNFQGAQPVFKFQGLSCNDVLGPRRLLETLGLIHLHNPLEIVNIVKINVVNPVYLGVNIPRYGDIDEKQWAVAAGSHLPSDVLGTDYGL